MHGVHTDALPPILPGLTPTDAEAAQRSLVASSALLFIKNANQGPDFLGDVVAANITGGNYFRFSFL